jgi:DNA-binding NarL/FixJ family response regulator
MSAAIRVLVVDDQGVIRAGLSMIINHEPDMVVVGEASDGLQALSLVAAVRPDVVMMDIRMSKLDGIEATRRITAAGPGPAVLILTTFDDEEYVLGAIRAGAAGFLLKDAGPDVLVGAIRTLYGGDSLVDPAVTATLIARCLELERAVVPAASSPVEEMKATWARRLESLSDRERQTFIGLARGQSNQELATDMFVSETTIKSHVSSILTKLGLRNRVQAVVLAYETQVVRPGER